ncbi:MAG: hypothetical protein L0287_36535 [Anaerolineae bacterium]|nr:hypothetical protein [Anaerolineae bacterium]
MMIHEIWGFGKNKFGGINPCLSSWKSAQSGLARQREALPRTEHRALALLRLICPRSSPAQVPSRRVSSWEVVVGLSLMIKFYAKKSSEASAQSARWIHGVGFDKADEEYCCFLYVVFPLTQVLRAGI